MQHIAREGRCWVVGSGCVMNASDVPPSFPDRARLFPDAGEWLNPGDSVVVAPWGKIAAGPLSKQTGVLYADIDRARCGAASMSPAITRDPTCSSSMSTAVRARPSRSTEPRRPAQRG